MRLEPEPENPRGRRAKLYGKHIGNRIRRDAGITIHGTLYAIAKNLVDAINKEADQANDLKLVLAKSFEKVDAPL